MVWTVETLNATVDEEVNALPADMRAQLSRISLMIEEFGLERMREPHVKHLRGPLWEMRMRGQGRDIEGTVRRCSGEARRYRAGLCKEDTVDPRPGN